MNPLFTDFSYAEMKRIGQNLFSKIEEPIRATSCRPTAELSVERLRFDLELCPPLPPEEIQSRLDQFAQIASGDFRGQSRALLEIANILNLDPGAEVPNTLAAFLAGSMVEYYQGVLEKMHLDQMERSIPFEIVVLQLGELKVVFLSAEIFA